MSAVSRKADYDPSISPREALMSGLEMLQGGVRPGLSDRNGPKPAACYMRYSHIEKVSPTAPKDKYRPKRPNNTGIDKSVSVVYKFVPWALILSTGC